MHKCMDYLWSKYPTTKLGGLGKGRQDRIDGWIDGKGRRKVCAKKVEWKPGTERTISFFAH